MKWFFPNDPVVDFLHRNEMGPNYLSSSNLTSVNSGFVYAEMVQLIRAITVQDFDTSLTWDQAVQQQIVPNVPLTQLLNYRGLVITRSDWTSNGMRLMFQPRSEPGGHSIADRNNFTLSALGRIWVPQTDDDLDIAIARIDGTGPSIDPCALVDFSDSASFTPRPAMRRGHTITKTIPRASPMIRCSTSPRSSRGPRECNLPNCHHGTQAPRRRRTFIHMWEYRKLFAQPRSSAEAPEARIMSSWWTIQKDNTPHNYTDRIMLANDLTNIAFSGSTDAISHPLRAAMSACWCG